MAPFDPTEVSGGEPVAWVTQGVLLHIPGTLAKVWPEFVAAWDALMQRPWAAQLKFVRRWDENVWRHWDETQVSLTRAMLAQHGADHPYFRLELNDTQVFPRTSIEFQDVPRTHGGLHGRSSWLRVLLPLDTSERELFEVTRLLCELLPVQQGVAGYLCHVDELGRAAGYDQAWAWARRYYGLHIADSVRSSWDSRNGLCGVGWLTFLGKRWLRHKRLAGVDFDAVSAPLRSERTKHGVLLCAGKRPTLGDQNHFDDLSAYTLASQLVEPILLKEPSEFQGMFEDQESTLLWLRRFLEPAAWRDA